MHRGRIESLIEASARWILRKLEEWRTRAPCPFEWRDGAELPYLGESLRLRVSLGTRARVSRIDGELHATVRELTAAVIERAVVTWYKSAARALLEPRAMALAAEGGLPPPRIFISSARSRWGSCNTRREVRLAWRLVKAPPPLIDYVICHELAHFRHMNHSAAFWAEVARLCPEFRTRRQELMALDIHYRSF
jgi:predicted metal-dependent hydrolase